MNILYTTNDKFVAKVAASICSVFENNKQEKDICIYIIGQGISKENIHRFDKLQSKYNRRIEILEMKEVSDYLDFSFDTNGWNPIVLARLLLDKFLPEEVEKVLYIDGDTINLASLAELWQFDLQEKVLGGCIEATVSKKQKIYLGMEKIPYINAGVLLIDLKKWREEETGKRILQFYQANNGNLFANDQDAINGSLKGKIYYLPPKYNFYNIYWFYNYKTLKKLMGKADYYTKEVYNESVNNPAIIHYLGEERPWRKGNHHKYKKEYVKYLKLTPWKNEPEENGWETYFKCWDIFNRIVRPFPMLRYRIINGLIPFFMKWRKKQLKKERV